MDLTEEELDWALAIKAALQEKEPELAATITDFEVAHHAIIAKDKVDKALKRIRRLETFRKDHGIPSSSGSEMEAQDALQMIQKFDTLCSGMFLSFGQDKADEGRYVSVWDYSAFLPAKIVTQEDWQTCFAAIYYLFDAHHPDMASVRAGLVFVSECRGLGWKNFSLEMEKHAAKLYQDCYPLRMSRIVMVHAPRVFLAMYTLCKPFLTKKVKESIEFDGTLDQVLEKHSKEVLPKAWGGRQSHKDMEDSILEALKLRYSNMASYKLPDVNNNKATHNGGDDTPSSKAESGEEAET